MNGHTFNLAVQMATAWNDRMFREWSILRAGEKAPGLVNPEALVQAMERGQQAEEWRAYWFKQ